MEQRYASLLPFLLFASAPLAQTPFEYADQRTQQVHYFASAAGNDDFFVAGVAGDEGGFASTGFVTAFGPNGSISWSAGMADDQFTFHPMAAVAQDDGGVIVSGPVDGCDTGPWQYCALFKYDTAGSVVWQHVFFFGPGTACTQAPAGALAIWSTDSILVTTDVGDSTTAWSAGGPIMTAVWESDSVLVITSPHLLERRDASGTLLSSLTTTDTLCSAVPLAGSVVSLRASGDLLVFDQSLSLTGVIDLDSTFAFGQLVADNSAFWAVGNTTAVRIDASLNITDTIALDPFNELGPIDAARCSAHNNWLAICSNEHFENRSTGSLRTMSTVNEAVSHPMDIATTIEEIDSIWYTLNQGYVTYPYADVSVRITNVGSEVAHRLMLNFWYAPWFCSAAGTSHTYDGLDLGPGESIVLPFHDLQVGSLPWQPPPLAAAFCLAALSPDNIWDRDMSDNLACDTVHIVLGLAENPDAGQRWSIANPFTDRIELRSFLPAEEPMNAALLDADGRMITSAFIPKGATAITMDASHVPSGAYVLRVTGQRSGFARKLMCIEP